MVRRNRVGALRLRAARLALDGGELFPLDHGVAEHDHRARHLADLVARVGGGNAGAGVAVGELLHHAGQAVERARDAASDQPAEAKAERDHGDADRDNSGARARLRRAQPRRRFLRGLGRARDDFVRARQHVLAVDVDHRAQRMHAIEAVDPLQKGVGVSFHLVFERVLHLGRAVDQGEGVGEFFVAGEKLLLDQLAWIEPVFRFMIAHDQQRHHQFGGVRLGQPRHVLVDDTLDRVAGFAKIVAQPRVLVEAEGLLLAHQFGEGVAQTHDVLAQAHDAFGMAVIDRGRDRVEALQRERVSLLEIDHQIVARVGAEVLHDDAHRRDRALEVAAGPGELAGMLDGLEGGADVAFAGEICESVGEEADHRDQREHDDAGAHRNRGEQPAQAVGRKR